MKDKKDKKPADLLASPGARRQARYADTQRQLGRKQVALWLTSDEEAQLRSLLEKIRSS